MQSAVNSYQELESNEQSYDSLRIDLRQNHENKEEMLPKITANLREMTNLNHNINQKILNKNMIKLQNQMNKKPINDSKKSENLSILENRTNRQENKEIYRRKYNLSPSDFQSEQDIKQEQRRRNESRGSAANYPGIRI